MSEDVFFNEPGYEGEAGTEEGEKKNEAYSNIVRYGNILYAMIEQIKNPPKGFEEVIKRHFYLKKKPILKEVNKWIKYAQKRKASYTHLVKDHNSKLCAEFSKSPNRYLMKLKEVKNELKLLLDSIPKPTGRNT